jgi:predicted hotdog family 3-hydroxylacyl-ACP dehydratase
MLLVDRLIHFDDRFTITETSIREGGIFIENGALSAAGMMENIAQTCAARIGYINRYILKKNLKTGYIGAINSYDVLDLPRVGTTITTTAEKIEEALGILLVRAEVKVANKIYAKAEVKMVER